MENGVVRDVDDYRAMSDNLKKGLDKVAELGESVCSKYNNDPLYSMRQKIMS